MSSSSALTRRTASGPATVARSPIAAARSGPNAVFSDSTMTKTILWSAETWVSMSSAPLVRDELDGLDECGCFVLGRLCGVRFYQVKCHDFLLG